MLSLARPRLKSYRACVDLLRDHLREYSFDAQRFHDLARQFSRGTLSPDSARLSSAPAPIPQQHPRRRCVEQPADEPAIGAIQLEREALGRAAIAQGRIASLILNGGMATRFGGGAKGTMAAHQNYGASFLQLKLAQLRAQARALGGTIPVLVMNSFATRNATLAHLDQIQWSGIKDRDRYSFNQSIMPRLDTEGVTLLDLPQAQDWPDRVVYSAPGHGDALAQLQHSSLLDELAARGVEHLVLSNVDNIGAGICAQLVGAHLQGVAQGCEVSVEAVPRRSGEKGGCLALSPRGPAVFEGFRLPQHCSLDDYPDFNTNTIWISMKAIRRDIQLSWFPVKKRIVVPNGGDLEVIQFEQLIGELSEFVPSQILSVSRDSRFFPIKLRSDLDLYAEKIRIAIEHWLPSSISQGEGAQALCV